MGNIRWEEFFGHAFFSAAFIFVIWINRRQQKRAEREWLDAQGPETLAFQRPKCSSVRGREGATRRASQNGGGDAYASEYKRQPNYDFANLHQGHSSAFGTGYSGPSVNTNGAPMLGRTDIYGNSFGASASSGSSLNRWD